MRGVARIAILALAAAASAWALWQWSVRPVRCAAELTAIQGGTNAIDKMRTYSQREQRANDNLERLAPLRAQCPAEVRVPFLIGVNESYAGRREKAIAAFEEALAIDRRPEIYAALGSELLANGRIDEATDAYVEAARFGYRLERTDIAAEMLRRVRERLGER